MPYRIECSRCHQKGGVRLETVLKGQDAVRHYECHRCGYSWDETERPILEADRRTNRTAHRLAPRTGRRVT
jgi:hypothetical protein